jgi:hypothetical protein
MLMRMLDAGGVPPVVGSSARGYELIGGLDTLHQVAHADLAGRSVKLLDYMRWYSELPLVPWRFIWSDRDGEQQAKSTLKLLQVTTPAEQIAPDAWQRLAASYAGDRRDLLAYLRSTGPTLVVSYEKVLARPRRQAARIAAFLGSDDFDVGAAAAVVHRRTSRCAPDLAYEMGARA